MYAPIASQFLFDVAELASFQTDVDRVLCPDESLSFCQGKIAAWMKGQAVLGQKKELGCPQAVFGGLGWKRLHSVAMKSDSKCTPDLAPAGQLMCSQSRLPAGGFWAIADLPLVDAYFPRDTQHFDVDNRRGHQLEVDGMAALDGCLLHPPMTMNSLACRGHVYTECKNTFVPLPANSSSHNTGKTEREEIDVMMPSAQIAARGWWRLACRPWARVASVTQRGQPLPGARICTNGPPVEFNPAVAHP